MSGDTFGRFARKPPAPSEVPPEVRAEETPQGYVAFGFGKQGRSETRLRLHLLDGTIVLMSYAYLMKVVCTSHQHLALIFGNGVMQIEGRNLGELIEPLQDEKVRFIQTYDRRMHQEPAANVVLVSSIAWYSNEELRDAANRK